MTALVGERRTVINDLKGRKCLSCLEVKNREGFRTEEVITAMSASAGCDSEKDIGLDNHRTFRDWKGQTSD